MDTQLSRNGVQVPEADFDGIRDTSPGRALHVQVIRYCLNAGEGT